MSRGSIEAKRSSTSNGSIPPTSRVQTQPQRIQLPQLPWISIDRIEVGRGVVDQTRLRRALNVVVALGGLLLALPFMLIIALVIKLTSPGPVIYRQTRVGLDRRTPGTPSGNWRRQIDHGGRLFVLYKFRTMEVQQVVQERWATPDDCRLTPVGAFLRKYRLDELPQLINVLKGDMNVVGPRPEQPTIFQDLREQIGNYPRRQRVLPGITGWAQVNQPYDRHIDDVKSKLRLDLEYIAQESVTQDLKILALTVPTVLLGKGGW